MQYCMPVHELSDNKMPPVRKFFEMLCCFLKTRHLKNTAKPSQTNSQVRKFNKTIFSRLWHYVAKNERDWDIYGQPLTYAYTAQVHYSKKLTTLAGWSLDIYWCYKIPWCDGVIDWSHSEYILPCTISTIATLCSTNETRCQQENENGAMKLKRRLRQEYSQCAKTIKWRTIGVHWLPTNDRPCCRAAGSWFVQ